ncbi:MAG: C_GCAxxG_C_C family protein, partial [Euryarchaeota archaeon]|nr:C_GCAxxG_C_C family protein [Euryarchaeota archaeon]
MKTEEDCVNHATECWNRGLNCAESVMRGACFAADINLPDIAKRIATPFGGGIGRAEDICGALAGGVLAIGAVLGRAEAEDDRFRSYMVAKELHEAFLGRFGATACK